MKRFYIFFFICFTGIVYSQNYRYHKTLDIVKGSRVKTIVERTKLASDNPYPFQLRSTYHYSYYLNEKGGIQTLIALSYTNDTLYRQENFYNENGISKIVWNDTSISDTKHFICNKKGKVITSFRISETDSFRVNFLYYDNDTILKEARGYFQEDDHSFITTFDSKGRTDVGQSFSNTNANLNQKYWYKYSGSKTKYQEVYDSNTKFKKDNTVLYTTQVYSDSIVTTSSSPGRKNYTCKYEDDKGNTVTERQVSSSNGFLSYENEIHDPSIQNGSKNEWYESVTIFTYQYLYDAHGNWIKKETYKDSILQSTIEREITYY